MDTSIRSAALVREVLRHVCDRNEIVILTTPYLRFETAFLRLEEEIFHCHANMDLEDAKFGLRSPDLKIRFPYGHHFYEGASALRGLGRALGRPSLQLVIPESLEDGDYRRAYRVERVGRVPVTFSTRKYQLLMGSLVNISTSGLRLFLNRPFETGELVAEDVLHVAFTLSDSIQVNHKVKVRYVQERVFGAEFFPPLAGQVLDSLSRWAFQRREEDILAHGRSLRSTDLEPRPGAGAELLLVSSSAELEEQLNHLLSEGLPPLRRVPAIMQSVRNLDPSRQTLVLFHLDSPGWETRKRIKTLAEALPATVPFVLIGTDMDSQLLFELGIEWKAAWTYPLQQNPGSLFPRLLQGIFRKHFPALS